MDGMMVPVLIALSVAALVFAITQVTAALTNGERKKLKQRLSTELRPEQGGGAAKQITIAQQDFGLFGGFSPIEKIGKKLNQAYPDASLNKFLGLCAGVFLM